MHLKSFISVVFGTIIAVDSGLLRDKLRCCFGEKSVSKEEPAVYDDIPGESDRVIPLDQLLAGKIKIDSCPDSPENEIEGSSKITTQNSLLERETPKSSIDKSNDSLENEETVNNNKSTELFPSSSQDKIDDGAGVNSQKSIKAAFDEAGDDGEVLDKELQDLLFK